MDILSAAGILLSLSGGYLLILAVCVILGLLLVGAMILMNAIVSLPDHVIALAREQKSPATPFDRRVFRGLLALTVVVAVLLLWGAGVL